MKLLLVLALVAYAAAYTQDKNQHHHHYYGSVTNNVRNGRTEAEPVTTEQHDVTQKKEHHDVTHKKEIRDERIYRFHVGNEAGAYGYLDSKGELKGFWLDLLIETCTRGQKKCVWIADRYDNCWTGDQFYEYPGVGLLDNYYDACMGWLKTPQRTNSFNFTRMFTPASDIAIVINEKYFKGDQHNLTGRTAGHIKGWIDAGSCLQEQKNLIGTAPGSFKVKYYDTQLETVLALQRGEVDFIMISTSNFHIEAEGLTIVEPRFKCGHDGYRVMAHYGSEVIDWFNEHLTNLIEDGTYETLCEQAQEKHSKYGPIHCIHNL